MLDCAQLESTFEKGASTTDSKVCRERGRHDRLEDKEQISGKRDQLKRTTQCMRNINNSQGTRVTLKHIQFEGMLG